MNSSFPILTAKKRNESQWTNEKEQQNSNDPLSRADVSGEHSVDRLSAVWAVDSAGLSLTSADLSGWGYLVDDDLLLLGLAGLAELSRLDRLNVVWLALHWLALHWLALQLLPGRTHYLSYISENLTCSIL